MVTSISKKISIECKSEINTSANNKPRELRPIRLCIKFPPEKERQILCPLAPKRVKANRFLFIDYNIVINWNYRKQRLGRGIVPDVK